MMQQYEQAKAACGDALLLFRMGDFYELFHDDAKTAARVLQITLTSREKGAGATAMAGFPHHQLEGYLAKLISQGFRVAICDQVEDPKEAKGLVRREVTRIVSRGTLTDDALLEPAESNYLAAVVLDDPAGLAWVELSTGKFFASLVSGGQLTDELARIQPSECLLAEGAERPELVGGEQIVWTTRPDWAFAWEDGTQKLRQHFGTNTLEGFGFTDDDRPAIRAAAAILDYLSETQKTSLDHLETLSPHRGGATLAIDEFTRRSLELTRTLRDGRRKGSLLDVIDRTSTAMGARLLADWLASPPTNRAEIERRHDAVAELVGDSRLCESLAEGLRNIYDVQRLLARVSTGRASPRDLNFLGKTLAQLPDIKARLTARQSELLNDVESRLDLCPDVRGRLEAALEDPCPLVAREGGILREGFCAELDNLRELSRGGKQWIAEYQRREAERVGIPNLKVGYNKVFGYYLEVTHAQRDKVPQNFVRKQTLKNAERYITPELKEHEEKVLTAEERAKQLEYEQFCELRELVADAAPRLRRTAAALAEVDVLTSLAELARGRNYCRPVMVDEPLLQITDGRHPVLDAIQTAGTFVPNDTAIDDDSAFLLITGPNMAGKSTYIRQVALITILAQIGGFVPAREATIGIADRVFARVGASDELTRGQSTFMVEMTEAARILNTASARSLVILDEIGRGTSTYDGVSLAWAIVEFLHDRIGCRALFATHYHELTDLERLCSRVKNLNVAVREWQEEVIFLHKIVEGSADKSYGIQVARLAGVPREVVDRSKEILAQLEAEHLDQYGKPKTGRPDGVRSGELQLTLFEPPEHPLLEKIRDLDVNHITPIEAIELIHDWQHELGKGANSKPR